VGRGKSWLVDLFQLQQARHSRRLHFQHLMRDVHAGLARLRRRERPLHLVAAQMAARARVWCVDEFEVTDIADAMILHGLVTALLARGVVLVMTSNTPPARLYSGGLQRERFLPAIALLERQLDVVELASGPDYRLRQLEAADTYLASGDPQSDSRLRELFTRLAGAADPGAGVMMIEDRPVATRGHVGGLAWFDFAALCEGPRSAADYIAIAGQLHTVFLSGVPRFEGGSDDAARRFIALIDELYDRRAAGDLCRQPAGLYGRTPAPDSSSGQPADGNAHGRLPAGAPGPPVAAQRVDAEITSAARCAKATGARCRNRGTRYPAAAPRRRDAASPA
jgi:cell division protein ZapE